MARRRKEIKRQKNNKNKNNSNSSKPSSTNVFKKVILNNREKFNKKTMFSIKLQGNNFNYEDIEEIIENGEIVEIEIVIDNKNESNIHQMLAKI